MATNTKEEKIVDVNLFKANRKIKKDKTIDEFISKLVLLHKSADDKLKEISELCCKKEKDGE